MTDNISSEENMLTKIYDEIANIDSQLASIVSKGYILSDIIPRDTKNILSKEDLSWNDSLWDCLTEKKDKLENFSSDLKALYIKLENLKKKSKNLNELNNKIISVENSALKAISIVCD